MNELRELSLENFAKGAAGELFQRELAAILKNIDDINTSPNTKREITLKFCIEPDADRESAKLSIQASSKIAPVRVATGQAFFGRQGNKMLKAYSHNPEQLELDMDSPKLLEDSI